MLVTLADMKSYLGIPTSDTSQDAFLTEQLELISEVVEAYCRRNFLQATYLQTFYMDENYPKNKVTLFQYPVASITSIEENGTAVDPTEYRLNPSTGIVTRPDGYFFLLKETVIEYVAGVLYADLPKPIQSVVKSIVEERYNKKTSGVGLNFGSDIQRVSIPGTISIDFDYSLKNNEQASAFGTILGNHANILDFYRSDRALYGSDKLEYVI